MMLVFVGALFGLIFIFKMFQVIMMKHFTNDHKTPVVTISAMTAQTSQWEPQLKATGSLRTVKGVQVTTELAGMVRTINFTPGSFVQQGTLLMQLDIDPDVAQLHSLQATANLAKITYNRDKSQFKIGAVSKQTLDSDQANLESDVAQVVEQQANIAKKTISAPFSGKLGINQVNIGQYLNPGDKIVMLETLDPIYVDFYVPQEEIFQLEVGQPTTVFVDSHPDTTFAGQITTINPAVDANVRNVEVEATLPNPTNKLLPGMFVSVTVKTGAPKSYLTLPQTAISFNSYGDIVYILQKTDQKQNGHDIWKAMQTFVTTGETRGDQIAVLKGVKPGDMVVTSGQLKLKNGSLVIIDNSVVPTNNPNPQVIDE